MNNKCLGVSILLIGMLIGIISFIFMRQEWIAALSLVIMIIGAGLIDKLSTIMLLFMVGIVMLGFYYGVN